VSSDTKPPAGYRLDSTSRTVDVKGGAPARMAPITAAPSWTKVIGTTLRLFVRRRILRVPDSAKIGRVRLGALTAFAAVIVAAVAAVVVSTVVPTSHGAALPRSSRPALTPAQKAAQAAAARATAANTAAAANWIAAEVSAQAVVGCDPATCAAILQAGYGGGGQVVLSPGVRLPAPGAVVVATQALRAQYGAQLAGAAPAVIAGFGSGTQAVEVRVVVAGGQAAYGQAASTAIAARRNVAAKLIGNSKVHVYPAPRQALTAGLVDPRLLTVLQRLAAHNSVLIYSFADRGPGADVSAPYRQVEIIGMLSRRAVGAVARQLTALPDNLRPALTVVRGPGGNFGLTLRFKAPSPN
jgi:hypothetical protein